jgi:hypothetical protein
MGKCSIPSQGQADLRLLAQAARRRPRLRVSFTEPHPALPLR